MGRIRPFVKDDIPQVADLFMRVFHSRIESSLQALGAFFEETLFHNPWYDEALPSLVYQEDNGKIGGFLGAMPRRMSMNGRPIQGINPCHLMVDRGSRSRGIGVQLFKTFYSGPQDISVGDEANNISRKVCERAGATTVLLYSIHWIRLLRPSRFIMSFLNQKHGLPSPVEFVFRPFCRVIDTIVARMPQSPFRQSAPLILEEELTVETLLACLSEFSASYSLRPEYDSRSLSWLLEVLARKNHLGTLRKVAVRDTNQEILGWYLYYLNPGGISEVVQIGAKDDSINEVLNHLFYHAWRQGSIALAGRLNPRFIREFSDKNCLFHCSGSWTTVYSNKPEVLHAIHRGDAFLTRLECGWPIIPPSFT